MAPSFTIAQNSPDSHQVDPNWIVAFIPLKNRVSFDPVTMTSTADALLDPSGTEQIIIADGDTQSVSTSSSKENHVSGCQISLFHNAIDYRQVLAGGDYVFVWMFDNVSDYQRIRDALQKGTFNNGSQDGLNGYQDGLKFFGRISSCRRQKVRQNDGKLTTTYSVAANGFTELDSTQYFNPLVSKAHPESVQYLSDFGLEIDKLLGAAGLVNSEETIPTLIQTCLGFGPRLASQRIVNWLSPSTGDQGVEDFRNSVENISSPNVVYQIPSAVLKLLGMGSSPMIKNSQPTYADILRIYIGVHKYEGSGSDNQLSNFVPTIAKAANGVFHSADALQAVFIPQTVNFNMQSVWSIAKTFLNEPINEMFSSLRVDPTGHVMPTIMCRQLPMNSIHFSENPTNVPSGAAGTGTGNNHWASTPYLTLPRWIIDDSMIYSEDTGRTDAMRMNYVHVSGQDQYAAQPQQSQQLALLVAPPIVDRADIFRNGLRMYEAQLSAALNLVLQTQNSQAASFYSQLLADTVMNGHLRFQGTLILNGTQAPIVEGDNCVVGGIIYHIERVEHQAGYIDINRGIKTFTTTLALTHGVSVESDDDAQGLFVYPGATGDVTLEADDVQVRTNGNGG